MGMRERPPARPVDPVSAYAAQFPPLEAAREDGLLCRGGDLHPVRLLAAYSRGIFPWYSEGMPLLWWSPAPRCILPLDKFRLPRRSIRTLRKAGFRLTCDAAFAEVMLHCAGPRRRAVRCRGGRPGRPRGCRRGRPRLARRRGRSCLS